MNQWYKQGLFNLSSVMHNQVKRTIEKQIHSISPHQLSFLVLNLKMYGLLDKNTVEQMIVYINKNIKQIEINQLVIILKMINEIPGLKLVLTSNFTAEQSLKLNNNECLNWIEIEERLLKYINTPSEQRTMIVLSNISHLSEYLSQQLLIDLKQAIYEVLNKQRSVFQYYQPRWVQINMTALARLYKCNKLNTEQKQDIQNYANDYAKEISDKLLISEDRAQFVGNDLAGLAIQLKKLELKNINETYIYIEKQLINNTSDLHKASLIILIQCFGKNRLHSKKLFEQVLDNLLKKCDNFQNLQLHEFALVIYQIAKFWFRMSNINVLQAIKLYIDQLLTKNQKQLVNQLGHKQYQHQLEKIYFGTIGMTNINQLRERIKELLLENVKHVDNSHKSFLLWTFCIEENFKDAQQLFKQYLSKISQDNLDQMSQHLMLHSIYLLSVFTNDDNFKELYQNLSKSKNSNLKEQVSDSEIQNQFYKQICDTFKDCQILSEYDTGYYVVDIFIKELNLIVEVQGIFHEGKFQGEEYNQKTLIKTKTLERLGYKVVSINVKDYLSLHDGKARQDFLRKNLNSFIRV